MKPKAAILLLAPLLMTACGGGSSSSNSSPSIAGGWQMNMVKAKTKLKRTQTGFLLQNNNVVTGQLILTDAPCSGVGSVTGSVSGTAVTLTVGLTGVTVNLTGTLGSGETSMNGIYTILPSGCGGTETNPQESGTWTASLVKPLSGNFTGFFTSKKLGPLSVTGRVSQGQNTGNSEAPLRGNLAITGYCFAGANIDGLVSGNSVIMNLVSATGVEIAQVSGTSTVTGGSTVINGTYHVIPQGIGGTPPCVDGDGGIVQLTL